MSSKKTSSQGEELTPPKEAPSSGTKLTERQLKATQAIALSLGWTTETLSQHCLDAYQASLEELLRVDASTLIGELQKITARSA